MIDNKFMLDMMSEKVLTELGDELEFDKIYIEADESIKQICGKLSKSPRLAADIELLDEMINLIVGHVQFIAYAKGLEDGSRALHKLLSHSFVRDVQTISNARFSTPVEASLFRGDVKNSFKTAQQTV